VRRALRSPLRGCVAPRTARSQSGRPRCAGTGRTARLHSGSVAPVGGISHGSALRGYAR
jgi:hypothetical protein